MDQSRLNFYNFYKVQQKKNLIFNFYSLNNNLFNCNQQHNFFLTDNIKKKSSKNQSSKVFFSLVKIKKFNSTLNVLIF